MWYHFLLQFIQQLTWHFPLCVMEDFAAEPLNQLML